MELTEDKVKEIATSAASKVVEGLKEPVRKFVPNESEVPPETKGQFKSFGEFLKAVSDFKTGRVGQIDQRLKALSEGTDTAGGYLVPEQWAAGIESISLESAIVRPLARKMPMSSDVLNYPVVTDRSHSSSVHGGVIGYWTEEAGAKTPSQPTFGRVKLIAKKLTGFTYASDELLEDSAVALEALLLSLFGEAITWFEEESFWQGSGVGQPLGIFTSGALLTPFRATANDVTLADFGMLASRFEGNLKGASVRWVANQAVLPKLMALGSTVVTYPILQGMNLLGIGPLGIPIVFTEHVATLGSVGDIGLYDFGQYLIGDRKGLKIDRSVEYRFSTDETTWRFVKRVDGQPLVDSAFTPKRGTTKSPFVCLASTTQ